MSADSDGLLYGYVNRRAAHFGDKHQVLRETARVLKPGGRFAISDVIADEDMDDATRAG